MEFPSYPDLVDKEDFDALRLVCEKQGIRILRLEESIKTLLRQIRRIGGFATSEDQLELKTADDLLREGTD
jgi:hypothetical protein